MAWIPRPLGEGLCYHVRVQCNNRDFRFQSEADFTSYLSILFRLRKKFGFLLHHFAIMHTHVHLIISTPGPFLLNRIMQVLNHHTSISYHRRNKRTGHFWMHGYRCSVIDSDSYGLVCMRYLDRNAQRAGIVAAPEEWPWSGYEFYASGIQKYKLDPHPSYLGLAESAEIRQLLYQQFVRSLFPADEAREKEMIGKALRKYGARIKT